MAAYENDWVFKRENVLCSPTLQNPQLSRDHELIEYQKASALIVSVTRKLNVGRFVTYSAHVYFYRFFQRYPLTIDKYVIAALSSYIASRYLEVKRNFDDFVLLSAQIVFKMKDLNKTRKEFWDFKKRFMQFEKPFMDGLCYDFKLLDPFEHFKTLIKIPSDDVYGKIRALIEIFSLTQIFLLYDTEDFLKLLIIYFSFFNNISIDLLNFDPKELNIDMIMGFKKNVTIFQRRTILKLHQEVALDLNHIDRESLERYFETGEGFDILNYREPEQVASNSNLPKTSINSIPMIPSQSQPSFSTKYIDTNHENKNINPFKFINNTAPKKEPVDRPSFNDRDIKSENTGKGVKSELDTKSIHGYNANFYDGGIKSEHQEKLITGDHQSDDQKSNENNDNSNEQQKVDFNTVRVKKENDNVYIKHEENELDIKQKEKSVLRDLPHLVDNKSSNIDNAPTNDSVEATTMKKIIKLENEQTLLQTKSEIKAETPKGRINKNEIKVELIAKEDAPSSDRKLAVDKAKLTESKVTNEEKKLKRELENSFLKRLTTPKTLRNQDQISKSTKPIGKIQSLTPTYSISKIESKQPVPAPSVQPKAKTSLPLLKEKSSKGKRKSEAISSKDDTERTHRTKRSRISDLKIKIPSRYVSDHIQKIKNKFNIPRNSKNVQQVEHIFGDSGPPERDQLTPDQLTDVSDLEPDVNDDYMEHFHD
ncbi:hypothetical protein WICMUC_005778 [Wickerhamomyces mucosus]|uniref:Cyclin-like domain-containing protein n=1 Tax=Wickerhamomyces mucosus TaxID=1378264 RepID=A0A9P8P2J8_9ASCO|nr:hypothetical protein WICMUC_005778 [Wickerhamomyces mucosus]